MSYECQDCGCERTCRCLGVEEPATMRDRFAMAALSCFALNPVQFSAEVAALAAYEIADAMMKERAK